MPEPADPIDAYLDPSWGPKRIYRQRTKGWRMPEGAVYVGRPTRWGNPFYWQTWGLERSLTVYRDMVMGIWDPKHFADCDDQDYAIAYETRNDWNARFTGHPLEEARAFLRGCDLVCWCPFDRPCHADVLLELANA